MLSVDPHGFIFFKFILLFGCLCIWCDAFDMILLLNQAWVPSPTGSKAHLLTLGCAEGKCSVYSRHQERSPGS